jgi:general secretion pathway protein E
MTSAVYKTQAKRLAEHLSRVHGVKIKQASMLEAVASLYGRPDWNTLLACGPTEVPVLAPSVPTALSVVKETSSAADADTPLALFYTWLDNARVVNASNLDIRPSAAGYDVFIRVDGIRRRCHAGSLAEYDSVRVALYSVAGLNISGEYQHAVFEGTPELAQLKIKRSQHAVFEGRQALAQLKITLSTQPIRDSERAHLFLRWTGPVPRYLELEELGLSKLADWKRAISLPSGVCLVAGATGAGRTSTLVATARALADEGRRVIVISPDIDPRWVPGADFRHQYPGAGDVLVLDVLRDVESAQQAFEHAANGVLVVAAIHAPATQVALARLRDLRVTDSAMDSLLNIVMAQQLVRSTCRHCAAKGCTACEGTGYGGRIPVCESVAAFPGRPITAPRNGKGWSMPTMLDDAVDKVRKGLTTRDEIARVFGQDIEDLLK